MDIPEYECVLQGPIAACYVDTPARGQKDSTAWLVYDGDLDADISLEDFAKIVQG